ncbi:MAG: hypothetical protein K5675_02840, partial [Lachnospiraceae bacterium]|nr:hypothetical protein [Lachnospiraceae bacterium]
MFSKEVKYVESPQLMEKMEKEGYTEELPKAYREERKAFYKTYYKNMTDEGIDRRLDEMVPRWIDRFFVNYEGVHYRITGTQQVEASLKGEKLYLKDTLNELDGTTLLLWQPEKEFFPENVKTTEDGCISIKLKSALLDRYEGGVDRYTLYFLNREKRLAYTVQKEVDRSEMYNNFHRLLGTVDCGEYHD